MGRPRNDDALRMDTDLRVPMTAAQKALLDEATADEPQGKAAWARAVLLEAAGKKIAKRVSGERRPEDEPSPEARKPGGDSAAGPQDELGRRFQSLARQWRKETAHLSSASQMARHPAYREIVRMGWAAVPLLIAELRRKPDHWFIALEEITGANPVPEDSEGRVRKMAQAWIRWADEGGRPK